jgi:hypothetical protein
MGPLEEPVDRMPDFLMVENADGTKRLEVR